MDTKSYPCWLFWFFLGIQQHDNSLVGATPLWADVCTQENVRSLPFCDTNLGIEYRVADYTQRIPAEAQINMMNHVASGYEPLQIPPYQWWSEGLHGPLENCVEFKDQCVCPTSFPCPSALGAAFNTTLYRQIGEAIGKEGKAISNLRPHTNELGRGDGLTYWSPTINLQRDPRWGRNQEGMISLYCNNIIFCFDYEMLKINLTRFCALAPGEDPHLTSQYAVEFVQGLQGDGATLRIGAACKHFVANSLEGGTNTNISRYNFDAHVTQEDLQDYYFPPFRECVKYAVGTMCSYNALNGIPTCANEWLLKSLLREEWGFSGYVTSDCGALGCIVHGHHYATDPAQASAMAMNASVDINCGNGDYYPRGLLKAYREGWVQGSTIRESFARSAGVQFRLGLFDPKESNPEEDAKEIGSHGDLALEAALQSIVLLQNRRGLLPLDPSTKLALIGPHINATSAFLSNYHGAKCGCGDASKSFACIETPMQALSKMTKSPPVGVMGCHVSGTDLNEIEEATKAAQESDAVIIFAGLDQSQESEGLDREQITLPGLQPELIKAVLGVAASKTILVLIAGSSVSLGEFVLKNTPAIVSAQYGGQAASHALANVLFGDYNPTGKLAATIYPPSFADELPLTEMGVRVGVGRTHLYYKGTPEFPFGHGLSYSRWQLEWGDHTEDTKLEILGAGAALGVNVVVRNAGPYPGSQSVLLFWQPESSLEIRQKLIGFQGSQMLDVGEEQVLRFEIQWEDFALWNEMRNSTVVLPGAYSLVARASGATLTQSVHLGHPTDDNMFVQTVG